MEQINYQADYTEVKNFLLTKLAVALKADKYAELKYLLDELKDKQQASAIYMAFSKVARIFGKDVINYNDSEQYQAGVIRKNWTPPSSVDKASRLLILLEIPVTPVDAYITTLENLFDSGDVGELVALYSALPIFAHPDRLINRCIEGARTNMGDVFESVANNNPYPADYLNEDAFNQMVLKCLFIGKPLYKVVNLNHRLNKQLALMASDYAHERFAALRKVNPELWQLLAPFMQTHDMKDMERMVWTGDDFDRQAVALACSVSQLKEAKEFFENSNYKLKVEQGEVNWHNLGVEVWGKQ